MGVLFSFSVLRIRVTVRASFLLMAAVLGFVGSQEPQFVVAWVAIVFVSILVHELGHALTARRMGAQVEIELNGLGGLTRWGMPAGEFGPGKRALVAGAGSAVGMVFGGLVWLVASRFGPYTGITYFIINNLIFVNVFWGLLNWAPIRPLDGGHLLLSLLQKVAPRHATAIARGVFTVTSGVALLWAWREGLLFIAILAGWMLLAELTAGGSRQPVTPIPQFSYDDAPGGAEDVAEAPPAIDAVEADEGDGDS